jgi:glycosyltransferase involved in cell wall biosynthesis
MSPGEADGVVRTCDLNSSPRLRRLLRRPSASALSADQVGIGAPAPALLTKVIVPDAHLVSWNPWAMAAIRRVLRNQQIDCLITSGPPDSTHLLGLALGRRRPAWLADFRDGWLFEPPRDPFPTAPQRALERLLERRVAQTADAVLGVTGPIVEDFVTRLGVAAELVPNAWDPELEADLAGELPAGALPRIDERSFTFVHTGTMSGSWGRDPRPLLVALRRLIEAEPELAGRVELLLAGPLDSQEQVLLERAGLGDNVRYVGYVAREQALALQRAAGALVLITSPNRGEATGKLYEYLAAARPIIALAEGNEAARIVRETNTGVAVAHDDVEAISAVLRRAVAGELERAYAPRALDRYRYPGPAQRVAQIAERVLRDRAQLRSSARS